MFRIAILVWPLVACFKNSLQKFLRWNWRWDWWPSWIWFIQEAWWRIYKKNPWKGLN